MQAQQAYKEGSTDCLSWRYAYRLHESSSELGNSVWEQIQQDICFKLNSELFQRHDGLGFPNVRESLVFSIAHFIAYMIEYLRWWKVWIMTMLDQNVCASSILMMPCFIRRSYRSYQLTLEWNATSWRIQPAKLFCMPLASYVKPKRVSIEGRLEILSLNSVQTLVRNSLYSWKFECPISTQKALFLLKMPLVACSSVSLNQGAARKLSMHGLKF